MRAFFKYMFASMFGSLIAIVLGLFLFFVILTGIAMSALKKGEKEKVAVKPNSIMVVKLNYDVAERTTDDFLSNFDFATMESAKNVGLNSVLASIRQAKTDDNIKGILLDVSVMPSGLATVEAIRRELVDFKSSKKFIYAYGEMIGQKSYYLASVADKVYLNPVGVMELRGFSSELMFFKNMLDKLGIEPEIFYAGKYKSATEPLRLTEMSPANEEQVNSYMNDIYGLFIKDIADARKLPEALVDSIADNLLVRTPHDALKEKLVDGLKYYDEVLTELMGKVGAKKIKELNLVSIEAYASNVETEKSGTDKIAVLYASGNIVDGEGDESNIGSERFAKAIRQIREDDKIKALVLRVNSGGGSALASDVILRELELANKKMPVIVSMGDVAASGGYYIASGADTIVAEPNTITGSIGVFGVLVNMQEFFNDKLGITFDGVRTGKYSDMGNPYRPLTPEEKIIIQSGVDTIYMTFKERVASGRGKTVDEVDSIAQGRVWTGKQAKEIGLVDVIGGLDVAIKIAAEKAGIKDYGTEAFPKMQSPLDKLFGNAEENVETYFAKRQLGDFYPIWKKMEEIKSMNGIQARMPYEVTIY